MKIDNQTFDRMAHLARLTFSEAERTAIMQDMNKMLDFVEQLQEVDTQHIEPLIYMTDEFNLLRSDNVEIDITKADALKNAPKKDSDYFRVAKVIEK